MEFKGYSVFYLQNITDIDDKIINRAKENGEDPLELSHRFEKEYLDDMALLNVNNVNFYARATEHMDEIIGQIQNLIEIKSKDKFREETLNKLKELLEEYKAELGMQDLSNEEFLQKSYNINECIIILKKIT